MKTKLSRVLIQTTWGGAVSDDPKNDCVADYKPNMRIVVLTYLYVVINILS